MTTRLNDVVAVAPSGLVIVCAWCVPAVRLAEIHRAFRCSDSICPECRVKLMTDEADDGGPVEKAREPMTKDDDGSYLWERCYACGHRLRFASDGCPQCGIHFDGRKDPKRWPEQCECERCVAARQP